MGDTSEVLFVTPRMPYPPNKGDKIRSWRLLKHLSNRFAVNLVTFVDDRTDFAYTDKVKTHCKTAAFIPLDKRLAILRCAAAVTLGESFTLAYHRSAQFARAVDRVRRRPLTAEIAFSSAMAPYIARAQSGALRIIDFCDADSEKWRAYGNAEHSLKRGAFSREADLLARAETRIANWADISFAVTPQEAELFNAREDARRRVDYFCNGVDAAYFDPTRISPAPKGCDVIFVGMMNYRPNVEAVLHFVKRTWPSVREEMPQARFAVVGAEPVRAIRALDGANGVLVAGRVNDVRPWLKAARVAVAPLALGRGVQNKVLEAMAMGLPMVLTEAASTGAPVEDGGTALIAQTPEETARAIARLLKDHDAAQQMGLRARQAVMQSNGWPQQMQRFDRAIDRALNLTRAAQTHALYPATSATVGFPIV